MAFDREIVEAQLALGRIGTTDLPKLAWCALEAGLDGPATRRLAALDFPNVFQVREVLPHAIEEWRVSPLSLEEAALRLAKRRAREILETNDDPLKHARDFQNLRANLFPFLHFWSLNMSHEPPLTTFGNISSAPKSPKDVK